MYNSFFGLREKPFKLVPNPDYLYLSKHHEIALAHLTYAVGQGDGFVVITGEVGTGKTTLCRNFLDRLDDKTASAYIFNPKLDSVELLTSICNEFGIQTNHTSLKQLLDVINGYLILKNKAGSKVVLLIDEAQNLSVENLEMVRMLSNLETTRNKLLQIILVGQPELSDKLDSHELRQLAQRISLSAYLSPLSFSETTNYIHHRVHIAAQRALTLFTPSACRLMYKYSNGIPRMINIACDRALLTAFSLGKPKVTVNIAKIAIRELSSRGRVVSRSPQLKWLVRTGVVLAAFLAVGALFLNRERISTSLIPQESSSGGKTRAKVGNDASPEDTQASLRTYKINEIVPSTTPTAMRPSNDKPRQTVTKRPARARKPERTLQTLLDALEHESSRFAAIGDLLELWRQPHPNMAQFPVKADDEAYFDIAAHQYGLRMHPIRSDWALVKHLNLPAIVSLRTRAREYPVFAVLERWEQGTIHLRLDGQSSAVKTDLDTLLPYLQGTAYIYWENIIGFDALIKEGAQEKAIDAVKGLLRRAGYDQIAMDSVYDEGTRKAILDFQKRNHLEPDGLIGPLTKILLIKEANAGNYPKLSAQEERSGA